MTFQTVTFLPTRNTHSSITHGKKQLPGQESPSRLSTVKVSVSVKVKFMSKHSGEKERGKTCHSNKFPRSCFTSSWAYESCLIWPVNNWFQKVNKISLFPKTPFLLSNKLKNFFCFSFISRTFGNNQRASPTASSKEHDCMAAILFQTN